jgi:hypothetical protein
MAAIAAPLAVLLLVGSWGTLVAWIAAAAAVLQGVGAVDLVEFMAAYGALPAVFVLCGFYAGFVARLAAASRFDVRLPSTLLASGVSAGSARVATLHALMAATFVVLMIEMSRNVEPLILAWGILSAAVGWYSGHVFLFMIFVQKPELERAKE